MKKILFIFALLLLIGSQGISQPTANDFVIVGAGSNDGNLHQVQKRYQKKGNAYQICESATNPMEQIARAIDGRSVRDLHIFLTSKPGELMLNSTTVTSANVATFTESLLKWKNFVTDKVVIHSLTVFTTPEGAQLKQQLEKISGLEFITMR